jgi:tetratricopeptide (TPR) repeat protein
MKTRHIHLAALCCAVIFLSSGCAFLTGGQQSSPPARPEPDLSQQAQATYSYLQYQELMRRKQPDKAVQALKKALKKDPAPELFLELASFYWQNEELDRSEAVIKQGLRAFPGHEKLGATLAKIYLARGKTDRAAEHIERFLEDNPRDRDNLVRLAQIHLQQDKHLQALDLLKRIPDKDRTAKVHYLMGQAYAGQNNRHAAIAQLKRATEIDPSFMKARAELAYQYELTKDYAAAEETYADLLDRGASNPEIFTRLIDLNLKLNNPDNALKYARQGPDTDSFRLNALSLFLQNEFYAQAKTFLGSLGENLRSSPRARLYQAILAYQADEDMDEALSHLRSIGKDSELYERSLSLQCRLLFQQGKTGEAEAMARKGQSLFPREPSFWLLEAEILRSREREREALEVLKKGLERIPDNTQLLFQLGVAAYELDRPEKAIEYMERIISIDPEHAQALNFVGYTLVEQDRDLERAGVLIKKALHLEPGNGYFLDSLAWLYFKTGRLQKAWKTISEAVNKVQNDPVIWEHFGDIAKALNKPENARKGYEKALQGNHEEPQIIKDKLRTVPSGPQS